MKQRNRLILVTMLLILMSGCDDERSVRIATEAADRQAKQNQEMARVNREVAQATKQLVAEEGASRREIVKLQQGIQKERAALSGSWNALEVQREKVAASRRTDSFLTAALDGLAIALVAALSLAVAWLVLFRVTTDPEDDRVVTELLLKEFAASDAFQRRLLPLAGGVQHSIAASSNQPPRPSLSVDPSQLESPSSQEPRP